MPRPDYAKDAEENKEFDKTLDPEGNFQKGVYKRPSVEQLKEGVDAKEKDLSNRLLQSIGFEATAGTAFDIATAPLGILPPIYAALQVAQGSGTNILAQMWRRNGRIDWGEVAASGAVGLIPGAAGSASGLKAISKGALRGSAGSIVHEGIRIGIDEKRLPTLEETATAASIGGVVGGGLTGAVQGGSALKKQITDVIENPYKYAPEGSVARLVSETGGGIVPPGSDPYKNLRAKQPPEEINKVLYKMRLAGMPDGVFRMEKFNETFRPVGGKARSKKGRQFIDAFESIIGYKKGYSGFIDNPLGEVRFVKAEFQDFIQARGLTNKLPVEGHHIDALYDSLPLYEGIKFNSDEWWDLTIQLLKRNVRPGSTDFLEKTNYAVVLGKGRQTGILGEKGAPPSPHGLAHRVYDDRLDREGFWKPFTDSKGKTWTLETPGEFTDETGKVWKNYRSYKADKFSDIVNESEDVLNEAMKVWRALNPKSWTTPENEVLQREFLDTLDDRGLLERLPGEYQVREMKELVEEIKKLDAQIEKYGGSKLSETEKSIRLIEMLMQQPEFKETGGKKLRTITEKTTGKTSPVKKTIKKDNSSEDKPKKKNKPPSPRYKTTDYKNLRPASERMGKKIIKKNKPKPE